MSRGEAARSTWSAPLHGLRGAMASAVCAAHLLGSFLPLEGFHHAVDVFFVLSGYVLCIGFDRDLPFGRTAFLRFLVGRVARLLPVAWLAVALYWSAEGLGRLIGRSQSSAFDLSPANLVANLLFLDANLPWFASAGPKWSLSNEMVAYLVVLPLAWLLRTRVVAATVLLVAVVAQALFAESWNQWGSLVSRCLPCFLAGCALYHLHLPPLPRWGTLLCAAVGCGLFLFGAPIAFAGGGVLLVVASSQMEGVLSRALRGRVLQWLGDISYPLYLLHPLVLYPVFLIQKLWPATAAAYAWWAVVPVAASLLAAHVVHVRLEEPLRRRWRPTRD